MPLVYSLPSRLTSIQVSSSLVYRGACSRPAVSPSAGPRKECIHEDRHDQKPQPDQTKTWLPLPGHPLISPLPLQKPLPLRPLRSHDHLPCRHLNRPPSHQPCILPSRPASYVPSVTRPVSKHPSLHHLHTSTSSAVLTPRHSSLLSQLADQPTSLLPKPNDPPTHGRRHPPLHVRSSTVQRVRVTQPATPLHVHF